MSAVLSAVIIPAELLTATHRGALRCEGFRMTGPVAGEGRGSVAADGAPPPMKETEALFAFRLYAERGDQHWLSFAFGIGFEGVLIALGPWCFGVEFGRG